MCCLNSSRNRKTWLVIFTYFQRVIMLLLRQDFYPGTYQRFELVPQLIFLIKYISHTCSHRRYFRKTEFQENSWVEVSFPITASACDICKNETLARVFSCELCEIKNFSLTFIYFKKGWYATRYFNEVCQIFAPACVLFENCFISRTGGKETAFLL